MQCDVMECNIQQKFMDSIRGCAFLQNVSKLLLIILHLHIVSDSIGFPVTVRQNRKNLPHIIVCNLKGFKQNVHGCLQFIPMPTSYNDFSVSVPNYLTF
jgi:hypothetical protein